MPGDESGDATANENENGAGDVVESVTDDETGCVTGEDGPLRVAAAIPEAGLGMGGL